MDITVGTDQAESGGQRYEISNVTIHPLYKGHDYDVCVIKVKGKIKFSETIAPVKMVAPGTELKNGVMLLTTGFGDTDAVSLSLIPAFYMLPNFNSLETISIKII